MGARRIRVQSQPRPIENQGRTLGLILLSIGLPMLLGLYLISLDTQPDFSDWCPGTGPLSDGKTIVPWAALRQSSFTETPMPCEARLPKNGSRVEMLGYMMSGYIFEPDGKKVKMFVLMPSAGHFLHAAHRNPDEMVEVWPELESVTYKDRQLVWVAGTFGTLGRSPSQDFSLYALRKATIEATTEQDVRRRVNQ